MSNTDGLWVRQTSKRYLEVDRKLRLNSWSHNPSCHSHTYLDFQFLKANKCILAAFFYVKIRKRIRHLN